jgi:hypothetical protein
VLSEHELLARFHDYGQIHGGELYLASTAAHDFVAACQENEIAVVGIEGFKVSGDKRLPLLDCIADYSATSADTWQDFCRLCNKYSHEFLAAQPLDQHIVFNLVTMSKDEWCV